MKTIIETIKKLMDLDSIEYDVIGMRPGEKFHEDMLAATELPFTYQPSDKLLTVLPQYTNRTHTYDIKYEGKEFNSELHASSDDGELKTLIERGLKDAN